MSHVIGYEFLLQFPKSRLWTQLHGSGGAVGNEATSKDPGSVEKVRQKLLARVRRELELGGSVRTSNDARHDEPLRIRVRHPEEILDCRPIYAK